MGTNYVFYLSNIQNNQVILGKEESWHCFQVLRKKLGETIFFTDGYGFFYQGKIIEASKKQGIIQIITKKKELPIPYRLHIGIAPPKNIRRMEWFVEKACEIGVSTITPLLCARSERKTIRIERLNRILIAALKQSQQAYLPLLNELALYTDFISKQTESSKFIAFCNPDQTQILKNYVLSKDILIIIGPEGDFTPQEVLLANQNKYQAISLGDHRLRTETAGIQACSWVSLIKNKTLSN